MSVWDPFMEFRERDFREIEQQMDALRREMDRTWSGSARSRLADAFLPGRSARRYPLVNLYDDKDSLYVEALAPGLDLTKLELTVQSGTLTLTGEKPAPAGVTAESFHRSERSAGRFVRTIDLPFAVDEAGAEARYQDGLLVVRLPRAESAKPKQINVRVG